MYSIRYLYIYACSCHANKILPRCLELHRLTCKEFRKVVGKNGGGRGRILWNLQNKLCHWQKKNRSPKNGCLAFLFWLVSTAENIIANILIKLRICWFWRYQQHKGSHWLIGWSNFPHGQRSSATLKVHLNDIFSSSGLANRAHLSSRLIT
jgi:hypothetical protein